ncbi:MAG: 6-phosphogluconate dehydrogenase NAD-binding protein [Ilumatobacteraceae bacterium]|nr:6-phosphogluconate dehydrogenase NAD-binding protein [Ilumatobacteraceae bacterium]MCU1388132.1 6-phosphogluconate dehydrogenase NAD-binding protein [Ilumatobacteraceae bacterium]
MTVVGFIGLGNMGSVLAGNLVAVGQTVVAHDAAGSQRGVDGATFVADVTTVAQRADVVVFSLPDGNASELVARQMACVAARRVTHIIDTSTIGPHAAHVIELLLADAGIGYVDAPVSGGVAGARARTLAVMYSGSDDACDRVKPVLEGLSDRLKRVGDRPGLAQAVKLANNFLSATALAATSEAVAFGVASGVDMGVMLEVLNASSGASAATSDKFPNHILTGRFGSGFTNSLMAKDVALYLREVEEQSGPSSYGELTVSLWKAFAEQEPGADFTKIYPYVIGR